jgi:hypothetical protein
MSTITKNKKSQEEFNAEVAEFFIEWNALSYEVRHVPGLLHERAALLMLESQDRTCPEWCDKTEHGGNVGAYWGIGLDDVLDTHSRNFGDSVAMGNGDWPSGVTLLVYIDGHGNIIEDGPQVHVEEQNQPTGEQARALASAISEAANFLDGLMARQSA